MPILVVAGKTTLLLILTSFGIALIVLHSLFFYDRFEKISLRTESIQYHVDELSYPNIIVCNKMPFTQAVLNNLGANFSQDYVLRYLREWVNPSIHQDPNYVALTKDQLHQADGVISSAFPQYYRTERLQTIMLQCQEFVNDCRFQEISITPFECCNMFFQPMLGTINGGLCWAFRHNNTIGQSVLDLSKGLSLTFSISRNSYSNFFKSHPGIDVYLVDGNLDSLRMSTELISGLTLKDKESVRMRMHKEYESDLRRSECGTTSSAAKATDNKELNSHGTAYIFCILQTILSACECLPLFVTYFRYSSRLYNEFEQQLNDSQVCSVERYEQCAKPYVEYMKPMYWDDLSSRLDADFRTNITICRKNFRPCQRTLFIGPTDIYSIPDELTQNTQDFIAKLTIVYETLMVTDTVRIRNPSFYEFLSFVGYNIALWFAIGHIIWYILTIPFQLYQNNGKVAPKILTSTTSPVLHIRNPSRQRLPPIDTQHPTTTDGISELV